MGYPILTHIYIYIYTCIDRTGSMYHYFSMFSLFYLLGLSICTYLATNKTMKLTGVRNVVETLEFSQFYGLLPH